MSRHNSRQNPADDQETDVSPSAPRARLCLKCQRSFESAWFGERICPRCKGRREWRQGAATKPHPASQMR